MKKWITIGILAVLVFGMVLMSGCTSSAPVATSTPTPQIVYVTVLVTPTTQSTITLSEKDKLFVSKVLIYFDDIAIETKQISSAAHLHNMETTSYWSSKLSSTCSNAEIELSAIHVSPEFQPIKDETLSYISDLKKGGDNVVTGVDYANKGQITLSSSYLQEGTTYINSANLKGTILVQHINEYRNKLGI